MPLRPVTVSQLNEYISRVLGTDPLLGNVTVRGEASGVKYHQSGHIYFSLVDQNARINCFLNRELAAALSFRLTDGMDLTLTGSISVYRKGGSYSLYVRQVHVEGAGSLQLAFEALKQKLRAEGLFDPSRKKPLPFFPDRIGIVTSESGAAIRDIMKNIRMRNQHVSVLLFPVLVQGDAAAGEIAEAIGTANRDFPDLDLLIVGRGGGSAEDLWAFNEETVARAIAGSAIPVISAVGHEVDFTISDMVADVRAETPTKAAVIAVPDLSELESELEKMRDRLQVQLHNTLVFSGMRIDNLVRTMEDTLRHILQEKQRNLDQMKLTLEYNDPRRILQNGYSILQDSGGHVVQRTAALRCGETYHLTLADGSAEVQVQSIHETERDGDESYE